MGWMKEFESEDDYLDALWTAHQDGECQEFIKSGECTYCTLESDRQKWEDKGKKIVQAGSSFSRMSKNLTTIRNTWLAFERDLTWMFKVKK